MGLTAVAAPVPALGVKAAKDRLSDPVIWVAALFLATFLLQRIAVPGLPISVTIPLAVGWMVLALLLGVVELNRSRLLIWLGAAGLSGLLVIVQVVGLLDPSVSLNSWGLWLVTWLPLVVQLKQRDRDTYLRFARVIADIGLGMAALSLVFIGSQLVGFRYYDWLSTVVPSKLLVPDFAISYPIVYGSSLYKSNGWITLEPSFMSYFLAVALICALLARVQVAKFLVLAAGLLSTGAGSGIALVVVFLLVFAVQGRLGALRRYLIPGALLCVLFASTVLGEAVLSRVGEAGQQNSSTSLRAILPYVYLWPHFIADPIGVLIGHGPGSSADLVISFGGGLLLPNVAKVVFDYGLVGGIVLLALMVSTYLRGPSAAFAISQASSIFLLQGPSQPLVLCSIAAISLWAPTNRRRAVPPRRTASASDRLVHTAR